MERKTIRKIVKALYVLVMPAMVITLDILLAYDYWAEANHFTWNTTNLIVIGLLNLFCISLFVFISSTLNKTKILPNIKFEWAPLIGLGFGINKHRKNQLEFVVFFPGFYIEIKTD